MQYRTTSYEAYTFDTFYFEKNLQGDIIAVYNAAGTKIGSYTYDAWGNMTITTTSGNTTAENGIVRTLNPFRYRGYYYDVETGLYYLQSRYYSPSWGRFLNEDGLIYSQAGLIGFNMYAYCGNNPVMGYDPTGYEDVCVEDFNEDNNPFNDLGHPQGRGGGIGPGTAYHTYTVRTQTAAYDGALGGYHSQGVTQAMVNPTYYVVPEAVSVTDDMAVNTTRGWKVGDNIQNPTKSGNKPSWPTVRARYWKNQAYYHPELYSDEDLALMRQGKAPQVDGQPLHLHHPYGREGANYWVFYPVTYQQHHFIHYGW